MNLQKKKFHPTYFSEIWHQFRQRKLPYVSFWIVLLFVFVAIYAPFLASSKPLVAHYDGKWYFPLFRYLFYAGFFTKVIDLFFNLLCFTVPVGLFFFFLFKNSSKKRWGSLSLLLFFQFFFIFYLQFFPIKDPSFDQEKALKKKYELQKELNQASFSFSFAPYTVIPTFEKDLSTMNSYAKLNMILQYQRRHQENQNNQKIIKEYSQEQKRRWVQRKVQIERQRFSQLGIQKKEQISDENLKRQIEASLTSEEKASFLSLPTLWTREEKNRIRLLEEQDKVLEKLKASYPKALKIVHFVKGYCFSDQQNFRCHFLEYLPQPIQEKIAENFSIVQQVQLAEAKKKYLLDKKSWLEKQEKKITFSLYPLIRNVHWEDDVGGGESLNRFLPFWELTRANGKDLTAALIFGTRISLSVGFMAVLIALVIGIPLGAFAGFFGGKTDIAVYRGIEIWESMPVFFMLLLVVGVLQTKSIFIVIFVIGFFGWTALSRYIRAEFLKQRNLPYVEACRMQGLPTSKIMFSHILPNALPPVLTLIPFSIMAAITAEAGLSFLGLGEEGSASWGVLMDEGRAAFPGESYLLWPPAILLTILLIAIALVGDGLRDAIDPKMRS